MIQQYCFENILLEHGWAQDTVLTVADGVITDIAKVKIPDSTTHSIEHVRGFAIPGMANAHSHAFQRAMAGNTEFRSSSRDSFWTWRQAMYHLANRITPADLQIVATQLFIEMLKAGYTSVAEFHYLHRAEDGSSYNDANPLWGAICAAAADAGIALTFLPTLYQTSDFGARALKREQTRFFLETDAFLRAIEARTLTEKTSGILTLRTGAAFHSLRAVPLEILKEATLALKHIDPDLPIHIHVAEQNREVRACKQETGQRPIELLLASGLVNQHWCLIHATHATAAELAGLVTANATVCVSITTEANLGDGFFDTQRFLNGGGRLCIGTDSQSTVCPAEELRWLEYQQRLRKKRRGVLANETHSHVGTRLWVKTALEGASAIGQPSGKIATGCRADWVVLDSDHPTMAGARAEFVLDHLIFSGASAAIRDVMVAGRWVVKDTVHAAQFALLGRFNHLMSQLAP